MKIILDECLPKRLTRDLVGHESWTVQHMGWSGVVNGKLLGFLGQQCDVFVTVDSNLAYQQNVRNLAFAIVVLRAPSNKIEDIRPLLPRLISTLAVIRPGQLVVLGD